MSNEHLIETHTITTARAEPAPATPAQPRTRDVAMSWAVTGVVLGVFGLVAAIMVLAVGLTHQSASPAQLQQLSTRVAGLQRQLTQANGKVASLTTQVSTLNNEMTAVSHLSSFRLVCTTDLTGTRGPAAFWFPCSATSSG